MLIHYRELVLLYNYCTRDHNMGFNPAWEYLGRSELQQAWYKFEYHHARFLKKVAVEVGSNTTKIALATGLGSIAGSPGGPAGVAAGALTAAVLKTIVCASDAVLAGGNIKIKRQWALHKSRKLLGTPPSPTLPYLTLEEQWQLFLLLTHNGDYYWPGYEKYRLPIHQFQNSVPEGAFKRLKEHFFFKPPKSGERLNQYDFTYICMLLDWNEASRKDFDIIWKASRCWPMLDYLFFNQSFYNETQNWKKNVSLLNAGRIVSSESLKSFLFASRYYFLSRDFYLDNFFHHVLPKYEIILSRQRGVVIGFNILDKFFKVVHQKVGGLVRQTESIQKMFIANQISMDILKFCAPHLKDLPIGLKIAFQHFFRSLFQVYTQEQISPHNQMNSSYIALQRAIEDALNQNENEYDDIKSDNVLSPAQRKFRLREILQKRRTITMACNFHQSSFPYFGVINDKETFNSWFERSGNEVFTINKFLGVTSFVEEDSLAEAHVAPAVAGGIDGGIEVGTEIINKLALKGISSLPPNQKNIFMNLAKIFGGVRLLSGSANFICKTATGTSLYETFLGESVAGSITGIMLAGPNVINILASYAIQRSKHFFYYRMDQICLSEVDALVVMDSCIPESNKSLTRELPQQIKAQIKMQKKESIQAQLKPVSIISKVIQANNYATDAKIFVESAEEFQNSKLDLLGVVKPQMEMFPSHCKPAYASYVLFPFEGAVKSLFQIKFFGPDSFFGFNFLQYAANVSELYAKIVNDWSKKIGIASALSQKSDFSHTFFHDLVFSAGKKPSNDIWNLITQDELDRSMFSVDQCVAMAQAWYHATYAAFSLLNLEKSLQDYAKEKSDKKKYLETQNVLDSFLIFIDAFQADKSENKNLLEQCKIPSSVQFQYLPTFIKTQYVFMRVIYLSGLFLYKSWLNSTQNKNLNTSNFSHSSNILVFLIHTNHATCKEFQLSKLGYDAPDSLNILTSQTLSFQRDLDNFYKASIPVSKPFNNFSSLRLGFKFTQDPNTFTSAQRQLVYKDFGRVVRHLFNSAPLPGEIYHLSEKLELQLQKISEPGTILNKKHISDFMDAYFEYIRGVLTCNLFIYYARVYQFIQETVREDFLSLTGSLRSGLLADLNSAIGPFNTAVPGPYKNNLEEIKLLCEQLNSEWDLYHPDTQFHRSFVRSAMQGLEMNG